MESMNQTLATGEIGMNLTTSICMWMRRQNKYGTARSGSANQTTARKMAVCATAKMRLAAGITSYENQKTPIRPERGRSDKIPQWT